MNILELATQSGLQVLLDARIGSQTYHSISGSISALQRFADSIKAATLAESAKREDAERATKQPVPRSAAVRARRAHRRALLCRRVSVVVRPAAATFRSRAG
ncbi:hypothetical protein B0G57_13027 [Trinickia symbiotica]|nr:hypothetical protein [Trinickia symbiotica]PPK41441.1 hypothetical protein B0G57_13027 [Trinickia symbiotica]